MASSIQLLRSTSSQERPFAGNLLEGQPALNIHSNEPGLFFKTTDGSIVKIGPVAITEDGSPPNSSPQGASGNSVGELWLDKSVSPPVLKVYDGSEWVDAGSGGGGGGGGAGSLARWTYTAIGGETSLSGLGLTYVPGLEQVFVNGVLLLRSEEYTATNGSSISNLSPLVPGDSVEVISLNPVDVVELPGTPMTQTRWFITAAAGQTILSGGDSSGSPLEYSPGYEQVFVNGAFLLRGTDYTATSGDSITMVSPLSEDDEVTVIGWEEFSVSGGSTSSLTYTAPDLGAVPRNLTEKLSDFLSVKDFGAVGDGDNDDTDAIRAAIDACQVHRKNLFFGAGKFKITSKILLPNTHAFAFVGEAHHTKQRGSRRPACTLEWHGGDDYMFEPVAGASGYEFYNFAVENFGTAKGWFNATTSGNQLYVFDGLSFYTGTSRAPTPFSEAVINSAGNWLGYSKFKNINTGGNPAPRFISITNPLGVGQGITTLSFEDCLFTHKGPGSYTVLYVENIQIDVVTITNCTINHSSGTGEEIILLDTSVNPLDRSIRSLTIAYNEFDTNSITDPSERFLKLSAVKNFNFYGNEIQGGGNRTAFGTLADGTIVTSLFGNHVVRNNGPMFEIDNTCRVYPGQNTMLENNVNGPLYTEPADSISGMVVLPYSPSVTITPNLLLGLGHGVLRLDVNDDVSWTFQLPSTSGAANWGYLQRGQVFTIEVRNARVSGKISQGTVPAFMKVKEGMFPPSPEPGESWAITFVYDGTDLVEIGRTARGVSNVDLVTDLFGVIGGEEGAMITALGYHEIEDIGGGTFVWDPNLSKFEHDGGRVIDPTRTPPSNWLNASEVFNWMWQGNANPGNGCWVRKDTSSAVKEVQWYGLFYSDANYDLTNSTIINQVLAKTPRAAKFSFPPGVIYIKETLVIQGVGQVLISGVNSNRFTGPTILYGLGSDFADETKPFLLCNDTADMFSTIRIEKIVFRSNKPDSPGGPDGIDTNVGAHCIDVRGVKEGVYVDQCGFRNVATGIYTRSTPPNPAYTGAVYISDCDFAACHLPINITTTVPVKLDGSIVTNCWIQARVPSRAGISVTNCQLESTLSWTSSHAAGIQSRRIYAANNWTEAINSVFDCSEWDDGMIHATSNMLGAITHGSASRYFDIGDNATVIAENNRTNGGRILAGSGVTDWTTVTVEFIGNEWANYVFSPVAAIDPGEQGAAFVSIDKDRYITVSANRGLGTFSPYTITHGTTIGGSLSSCVTSGVDETASSTILEVSNAGMFCVRGDDGGGNEWYDLIYVVSKSSATGKVVTIDSHTSSGTNPARTYTIPSDGTVALIMGSPSNEYTVTVNGFTVG